MTSRLERREVSREVEEGGREGGRSEETRSDFDGAAAF